MRILLLVAVLGAISLNACNPDSGNKNANTNSNANSNTNTNKVASLEAPTPIKPESPIDPNFQACNPYLPLVPGSQVKHTINFSSGLIADATVVVDLIEEGGRKVYRETTQIVDKSGGMQKAEKTVRKYVCEEGRVKIIAENTDNRVQDRQTRVDMIFNQEGTFMVEPAALKRSGTTWSYKFNTTLTNPGEPPAKLPEPITLVFTVKGEESVTVPAGTFKALKIERKVGDLVITEHYARGVGLVKRASSEGTGWALSEYSGVAPAE
ncbi:MAG TPA: hypothetical protein VNH22_01145 [Blastocatellia bacterium]|jgi:hypothetical protein|nr:hypothetical protein [Blastocatellia bacterium]